MIIIPHDNPTNLNYFALLACILTPRKLSAESAVKMLSGYCDKTKREKVRKAAARRAGQTC